MSTPAQLLATDASARRRAQTEFDVPLLVEAGAGSGKTSILVARIVAWSLGPGWERAERFLLERDGAAPDDRVATRVLSRVVAITFTDAAAAQMATRVGEWLGAIAAGREPGEIEPAALPAPELRRRRAGPLRASLDRLVVRTIHAWCRRLLAERPLEAGLHPAFEVDADEERTAGVVREVVEHALPRAYADPESPLSQLAKRGDGPSRVEEALLILALAGTPAERLGRDPFSTERIVAFVSRLVDACAGFQAAERGRLALARGSRIQATLGSVGDTVSALADGPVRTAEELAGLIATLRELWEPKSIGRLGDWAKGSFGKTAEPSLEGDEALMQAAGRLHRCVQHATRLDLGAFELGRRALAPLLGEVERRLRTAGIETFAALLRDAARVVSSSPTLAARIRGQLDQLLVDEFQDTDALQCEIVGRIGLEGEPRQRPTLFLVGDPRQSIYGWRSADLRAYDAFAARVEAAGGQRLLLARNFRSLPAVLDEVKRVIEPHMRSEPGVQPPFQDLVPHRDEGPGEVEHWISWGWDAAAEAREKTLRRDAAELEARALAGDVARLGREAGVAWRDVAILFRGMTDVDGYLDALRDAGVPYTVERDRRYFQRREVIEASALLRTVLDPHDHVALVAWLRSASVGVPDAAWIPLWTRRFPEALSELREPDEDRLTRLFQLVAEAAAAVEPGLPGHDRIAGWDRSLSAALRTLAGLRRASRTEPSDRFVERLRTSTLIEVTEASRYLGPYRVANLDQFFRDVRDHLEDTGGDVAEVLRRVRRAVEQQAEVEEARPREAADDAVRIMSIHKAKGLDFRHVYLMQLHKGHGGDRKATARVGRGRDGEEVELFERPSLGFGAAAEQEERTREAERVRTLYVAMTRARDRLVLVGKHAHEKDKLSGSHAELLAPRQSERGPLERRMARLARERQTAERDGDAVLWRFPALAPSRAERIAPAAVADSLPTAAQVAAASQALRERCRAARNHAARPWSQAASDLAHEAVRERFHRARFPEEGAPDAPQPQGPPRDAALAAAIGTAVHAALEVWDAALASEDALERACVVARAALPALVSAADLDRAVAGVGEILTRFAASPLHARFVEVAPHVVARELPVLLAPAAADRAVGQIVGTVDLLYREPGGEWVVADYKSDDVRSEAEMVERARVYAGQGDAYVRAVRDALGLETLPRFELWFVSRGECLSVS